MPLKSFTRPTKPIFNVGPLSDGPPFGPHHELTVYLPMAILLEGPGAQDPVFLLRWLADKMEREGFHTLKMGPGPVLSLQEVPGTEG